MTVIAALLLALFPLVVAGMVVCFMVCGGVAGQPCTMSAPARQPGFTGRDCEQNPNTTFAGPGVYGLPAPAPVWPGMWVGPAAEAVVAVEPVMPDAAAAVSPYPGAGPQRRQLSAAAQRVTVHGARR
jgi:hypothetical protein